MKNNVGIQGILGSSWTYSLSAGVTPSTAAAPDNTTTGNFLAADTTLGSRANTMYLAQAEIPCATQGSGGTVFLYDRLSHQGGLSGTVTTEQTTNLPTAALTRNTSGAGVFAFVEIYSGIGTTATTLTIRYTNQSGTPNQVSKAIVFGGASVNQSSVAYLIPLADGDTGIRSVEGVTLAGSTTTAGNFGVTLGKMLAVIPITSTFDNGKRIPYWNPITAGTGNLVAIPTTACVNSLFVQGSGGGFVTNMNYILVEDQ
jgi:hypothetical protein